MFSLVLSLLRSADSRLCAQHSSSLGMMVILIRTSSGMDKAADTCLETDSLEFSTLGSDFDRSQVFRAMTVAYVRWCLGFGEIPPLYESSTFSPVITNFKFIGEYHPTTRATTLSSAPTGFLIPATRKSQSQVSDARVKSLPRRPWPGSLTAAPSSSPEATSPRTRTFSRWSCRRHPPSITPQGLAQWAEAMIGMLLLTLELVSLA